MLILRILTSVVLKYQNRFVLNNTRCFLSSAVTSEKKINQENKTLHPSDSTSAISTDENNEWLWAYLRDRKSFSDLTEDQRRRVIEIGEINDCILKFYVLNSISKNFKHYEKVVNVYPKLYLINDGLN
jgi:hypothetical protein